MHHRLWPKLVAGGNEHVVFCGVALRAKSNAHDQLEYHHDRQVRISRRNAIQEGVLIMLRWNNASPYHVA